MSNTIVVHKGRTNVVTLDLGVDVSGDTITSQIRTQPDTLAPLIAEWVVEFINDGTDGLLRLTLDNSVTEDITAKSGYMDIKRIFLSEPIPVFDGALEVLFKGTVTV